MGEELDIAGPIDVKDEPAFVIGLGARSGREETDRGPGTTASFDLGRLSCRPGSAICLTTAPAATSQTSILLPNRCQGTRWENGACTVSTSR